MTKRDERFEPRGDIILESTDDDKGRYGFQINVQCFSLDNPQEDPVLLQGTITVDINTFVISEHLNYRFKTLANRLQYMLKQEMKRRVGDHIRKKNKPKPPENQNI